MRQDGDWRRESGFYSPVFGLWSAVCLASAAGVEPLMDLSETGATDVRVDLGAGDVGMTQHELYGAEIRSML